MSKAKEGFDIRFGVLTVSDRCSRGEAEDRSGPALVTLISGRHLGTVVRTACVPDEIKDIQETLMAWSDQRVCDVVVTSGGTGFAARDVTPEATLGVLTKRCDALALSGALRSANRFALLSRAAAGIRGSTLVVNLPGSEKGAVECFSALVPLLPHAVSLVRDDKQTVSRDHSLQPHISKVQTCKVSERDRTSRWPLISVKEAQTIIMAHLIEPQLEMVPLMDSSDRVLFRKLFVETPLPPFRASVKDGYAVVVADGVGPRRVVAASVAGTPITGLRLQSGDCVRVNTGGPVPDGADAVVQVEDTSLVSAHQQTGEELSVSIDKKPDLGQDIREIGSDLEKGALLLEEKLKLDSYDLGILAAAGISSVPCYRLPKVVVFSTGDELTEVGRKLSPGKVWDSNRPSLLSLLEQQGFPSTDGGILQDNPTSLLCKLKDAMKSHDVVITTGSVSMGDKDYLKQVLQVDLNANILFGRVDVKPGKPTTFSVAEDDGKKKLFFCLPGNPVSATVTCHLFVLPALRAVAGHQEPHPAPILVQVKERVRLDLRPEYKRVTISRGEVYKRGSSSSGYYQDLPSAVITGNQVSSRLKSFHHANGLLVLPSSRDSDQGFLENFTCQALLLGPLV